MDDDRPNNVSYLVTPDDEPDAVQVAAPPNERWAFASSTIRRVAVAGLAFWVSKQDFSPYVDQQLIADVAEVGFALLGTLYLGLAARARQLAAPKGPGRMYWMPRTA